MRLVCALIGLSRWIVEGLNHVLLVSDWNLCLNLTNERVLDVSEVIDSKHVLFTTFEALRLRKFLLVIESALRRIYHDATRSRYVSCHGLNLVFETATQYVEFIIEACFV